MAVKPSTSRFLSKPFTGPKISLLSFGPEYPSELLFWIRGDRRPRFDFRKCLRLKILPVSHLESMPCPRLSQNPFASIPAGEGGGIQHTRIPLLTISLLTYFRVIAQYPSHLRLGGHPWQRRSRNLLPGPQHTPANSFYGSPADTSYPPPCT